MEPHNAQLNQLVVTEKLGKQSLGRRIIGSALAFGLTAPAFAAEGTDLDFGPIGEVIKALFIGLIATIVLIGTAVLTVYVAIKGFRIINKLIFS